MNKKKFIAVIAVLLAAVAGWYFMYFTKTPVYSLNLAREAVEKHDVAAFKRHVDLDSIFGSAYDDMLAVEMEKPEIKNNPFAGFAEAILKGFKQDIVKALSQACYDEIGKEKQEDQAQSQQEASADEQAALSKGEQLAEQMNVNNLKFKTLQEAEVDGDVAKVPVVFEDTSNDEREVVFTVEMHRLDDRTWQAVRISNFKDYLELQEHKKAEAEKADNQ